MNEKLPAGVCACGLCFSYTIKSIFPLLVLCNDCGEEVIQVTEEIVEVGDNIVCKGYVMIPDE